MVTNTDDATGRVMPLVRAMPSVYDAPYCVCRAYGMPTLYEHTGVEVLTVEWLIVKNGN